MKTKGQSHKRRDMNWIVRVLFPILAYPVIFTGFLGFSIVAAANSSSDPVVDTGQSACYDDDGNEITCPAEGEAFYGQEAQFTSVTQQGKDKQKAPRKQQPKRQSQAAVFYTNVPEHPFDIILGRPTGEAITLSILTYQDMEGYIEYSHQPGSYPNQTESIALKNGVPTELLLDALQPDTRYYYRFRYRESGSTTFLASEEYSFHTQRLPGSEFTFTIQADSHLDENSHPDVYTRTLMNALTDRPDFHIDLGDTFMTDKYRDNYQDAFAQYLAQRYYFGLLCHSAPLFLVLGNHDGESGARLNGKEDNMTVWSNRLRKQYYPNPVPDEFYRGNDQEEAFVGLPENYYAWEWGDALFVVLDPYWPTRDRGQDPWNRTLGAAQYQWLAQTLEQSEAAFKFVFIHYLLGGKDTASRGGVAIADKFEWGGHNNEGVFEFPRKRSGWTMPIHQLLVENRVSVVFHGHDHLFAKEELDGVIYQLVPQPGSRRYENTGNAEEYGYVYGDVLSSPGHLRVNVSENEATVEYIRTCLPKDETQNRQNGTSAYSYTIQAKSTQVLQ